MLAVPGTVAVVTVVTVVTVGGGEAAALALLDGRAARPMPTAIAGTATRTATRRPNFRGRGRTSSGTGDAIAAAAPSVAEEVSDVGSRVDGAGCMSRREAGPRSTVA